MTRTTANPPYPLFLDPDAVHAAFLAEGFVDTRSPEDRRFNHPPRYTKVVGHRRIEREVPHPPPSGRLDEQPETRKQMMEALSVLVEVTGHAHPECGPRDERDALLLAALNEVESRALPTLARPGGTTA